MKPVVFLFKNRLRRDNGKYRIDYGYRLFKTIKDELGKAGIKAVLDGPAELQHLNVGDDICPIVVNWGCSPKAVKSFIEGAVYLNHPENVYKAVNKIETQKALRDFGVNRLTQTTSKHQAWTWFLNESIVLARTTVTGKSGEGIVVLNFKNDKDKYPTEESFPDAPLYSLYWPKTHEFRIHVVDGVVVDRQQKRKMSEEKLVGNELTYDKMIRSWENGWVFTRENIRTSDYMDTTAIHAVQALGLRYAAVDMFAKYDSGSNGRIRDWAVCEVNTSPGMEGATLDTYATALTKLIKETVNEVAGYKEPVAKKANPTSYFTAIEELEEALVYLNQEPEPIYETEDEILEDEEDHE